MLGMEDLCSGNGNLTCYWFDEHILSYEGSTYCNKFDFVGD